MDDAAAGTYKVAIATLTRGRPEMFGELLSSLAKLSWPENTVPAFIFVENDDKINISDHVAALLELLPKVEVYLENEPIIGIPFARNRALEVASKNNVDFLAFVDDDELVNPDWIRRILSTAISGDLDLVGGPLELIAPPTRLNKTQTLCWNFLVNKNKLRVRKADILEMFGRQNEVRIFTNNWLVRMDFVSKTGLRFDDSLGLSGGSDTKFYLSSRELGARTGWSHAAIVKDRIPLDRLTLKYQFIRARDQNMALYYIDRLNERRFARVRVIVSFLGRLIRGTVKIAVSVTRGGTGLVEAVTKIGAGLGSVYAAFGQSSAHYKGVE